ncbi:MAG: amidohydrolase family protein [Deltaproteobacteria bacterium]|uniref:Amidohydrolase family protein n=1 Tax=Candidatus Zymogenus saltonus TaxID=2844893 RepID=A0A9D8PQ70_9DELT|nr:amidohydrolase family protein [Candidatus Zymogenus saltonus]
MYDLIIRGGTVVDGTGADPFKADLAVLNGKIEEVGDLADAVAVKTIDAKGKLVTPGFVDIHSHADLSVNLEEHEDILMPMVMQGITTCIGGNCGLGAAPVTEENRKDIVAYNEAFVMRRVETDGRTWGLSEFLSNIEKRGIILNMGMLAPHGILRLSAAGPVRRLLAADEKKRMASLLERTMEEGAFGMSTGLQYFPGSQSNTEELLDMGKVLSKYGGVFTSHLRSYCHTLPNSIDEVLTVGRKNDIRVQISHIYWQPYTKYITPLVKGFMQGASLFYNKVGVPIPIELGLKGQFKPIDNAIADGLPVGADVVPTSQGFTELFAFFPPWVLEGGREKALERISDAKTRAEIKKDIEKGEPDWPHTDRAGWSMNYFKMTGWGGVRVMTVPSEKNRYMEGRSFPELGRELKKHPFDVMCDLLTEESGRVMVFHTPTVPDDPLVARSMRYALLHPEVSIVTDTILLGLGRPAHVFYDCFPRFLDLYAKGKGGLSIAEGIRKCTSLPAKQLGIPRRGRITEGFCADILVIDWNRLRSNSTFYEPANFPDGIEYVIINGKPVVTPEGYQRGVMAGEVLRRN